ncbi:MAG: DUF378 domain-containing protein [Alphaproteobacteria bacterium]|nr:DUF378 domain-containing protein [Alphaproteobacteria bacterium]
MTKLINMVCLPIVIIGAVNYGLMGLFGIDLLHYLNGATLIQAAQIIIGVSGLVVAAGYAQK